MQNPIHPELVAVGAYADEFAANLAKTALESAGINSMIQDDNASQHPSSLGFELLVLSDNAIQAREILSALG